MRKAGKFSISDDNVATTTADPDAVAAHIMVLDNIEALKSPYGWNAFLVLQKLIQFEPVALPSDAEYVHDIGEPLKDKLHQNLKAWYAQTKGQMSWDSTNRRFLPHKEHNFQWPDIDLISQLISSTAATHPTP